VNHETKLAQAAAWIREADGLLITAGAGMGVDSGLPDFRGDDGFWRAYPALRHHGFSFEDIANPAVFSSDPHLAWGFYGHRLKLYRATQPHAGFHLLLDWASRMEHGAFVFTSNVDGQFQRAGFDASRILEAHGAIDFLQCTRECGAGIFSAESARVHIDATTMRAREPLPSCPSCGALARPNILMFGDGEWDATRSDAQQDNLERWLDGLGDAPLLIIECGAGSAVPTVRHFSERLARRPETLLVRLNPREPDVPHGQVSLPLGALEGLRALDGD